MSVTRWDSISNTVPFRTLSEADVIAFLSVKNMHLIIRKNNVFFLLKTFEQIYNRKSSKR